MRPLRWRHSLFCTLATPALILDKADTTSSLPPTLDLSAKAPNVCNGSLEIGNLRFVLDVDRVVVATHNFKLPIALLRWMVAAEARATERVVAFGRESFADIAE